LCRPEELHKFWILLALGVLISLLQTASVASILPFLELASNPNALAESPRLQFLSNLLGQKTEQETIVAIAWTTLLFMIASNSLSVLSFWLQQKIAWTVSHVVSMRLVNAYAELPYEFFINKSSSDLIRSAIDDIYNLVEGVVLAGCNLVSQFLIAALILTMLIIVNPTVALTAVTIIGVIYLLIILIRQSFLVKLGEEKLAATSNRYQTFVEFISGIKTIKSNGVKQHFIERFEKPSYHYSQIHPKVAATFIFPRYIVETLAFGAVVFIALFLTKSPSGFVNALPTLTLFTLAGYRLIPAVHGIYVSIAQMLNSYPAIDSIYDDTQSVTHIPKQTDKALTFEHSVELSAVSYTYPKAETPSLCDVSIHIEKGKKIALIGPSGSGKTTLIDLVLGLLKPSDGNILIDGVQLDSNNLKSWKDKIGYVPQDVFLYNDTITNNIAFGSKTVDENNIRRAANIAQISDFIETELPQQYDTNIGDNGVRLSGGQRQRLGLARAFYRQPSVLLLDEATSALDNVTESKVIQAIHNEAPDVTIIMIAHRISTVVHCDMLYTVDRGKILEQGTYQELMEKSELFKVLARVD